MDEIDDRGDVNCCSNPTPGWKGQKHDIFNSFTFLGSKRIELDQIDNTDDVNGCSNPKAGWKGWGWFVFLVFSICISVFQRNVFLL